MNASCYGLNKKGNKAEQWVLPLNIIKGKNGLGKTPRLSSMDTTAALTTGVQCSSPVARETSLVQALTNAHSLSFSLISRGNKKAVLVVLANQMGTKQVG